MDWRDVARKCDAKTKLRKQTERKSNQIVAFEIGRVCICMPEWLSVCHLMKNTHT